MLFLSNKTLDLISNPDRVFLLGFSDIDDGRAFAIGHNLVFGQLKGVVNGCNIAKQDFSPLGPGLDDKLLQLLNGTLLISETEQDIAVFCFNDTGGEIGVLGGDDLSKLSDTHVQLLQGRVGDFHPKLTI